MLGSWAYISMWLGEGNSALTFARRQKLGGEEYVAMSWLEALQGDKAEAARSLQQYAAAHPWVGPQLLERLHAEGEMYAALLRSDGQAVLAAAGSLPDFQDARLLLAKGRAHALRKDYALAEQEFRRALAADRRATGNYNQSPLTEMLCHFYLGQVYEATGKREQAVNEYQDFLSPFTDSRTRLPQVAEARTALKRLMP